MNVTVSQYLAVEGMAESLASTLYGDMLPANEALGIPFVVAMQQVIMQYKRICVKLVKRLQK
jgi:hypothetical protein